MGDRIRILRAAAVRGGMLSVAPHGLMAAEDMRGADPLADAALRAAAALVTDLSADIRATMGLVIGTHWGCFETDREFDRSRTEAGGRYASPAAFSRTLPSTVMAEVSLKCRIKGPSLVVGRGETSFGLAIQRALRWMDHFALDHCLAGGMEWHGEDVAVGLVMLSRQEDGWTVPVVDSLPRLVEWIRQLNDIV